MIAAELRALMAAEEVVAAFAERWVRVDMNPREERSLRELNDALNALAAAEGHDRSPWQAPRDR